MSEHQACHHFRSPEIQGSVSAWGLLVILELEEPSKRTMSLPFWNTMLGPETRGWASFSGEEVTLRISTVVAPAEVARPSARSAARTENRW